MNPPLSPVDLSNSFSFLALAIVSSDKSNVSNKVKISNPSVPPKLNPNSILLKTSGSLTSQFSIIVFKLHVGWVILCDFGSKDKANIFFIEGPAHQIDGLIIPKGSVANLSLAMSNFEKSPLATELVTYFPTPAATSPAAAIPASSRNSPQGTVSIADFCPVNPLATYCAARSAILPKNIFKVLVATTATIFFLAYSFIFAIFAAASRIL